eukprot:11399780-Ditylum_brightwellii.AAC.1
MTHDVTSPTTKPAQEEATATDGPPPETSNPPSEDKEHEENIEDELDWKANLGYCTEEFLEQMLQHTTQYFPNCIESENPCLPPVASPEATISTASVPAKGQDMCGYFFSST